MSKKANDKKLFDQLMNAITLNDTENAQKILEQGVDLETLWHGEQTPLNYATAKSDCKLEMVALLLKHKADVNTASETYHDYTPLHWAIHNNRPDIANLLLEHGASSDMPNKDGIRPIDLATKGPEIKGVLQDARRREFKGEMNNIVNEPALVDKLYDYHNDGERLDSKTGRESKERIIKIKQEALTLAEAAFGKQGAALQHLEKKDKGSKSPKAASSAHGRG